MGYRDGIFAALALTISSVALAGMLCSDAYSHAAQAEASGYDALTQQLAHDDAPSFGISSSSVL